MFALHETHKLHPARQAAWQTSWVLKLAVIVVLLVLTNLSFFRGLPFEKLFRLLGLVAAEPDVQATVKAGVVHQGGQLKALLVKLLPLIPIWMVTLAGVAYAALDTRPWLRVGAALLVGLSTAFTTLYERIAGAPLTSLDIITLWNARHEASRAVDQFQEPVLIGVGAAIISFIVIVWPTRPTRLTQSPMWKRLWPLPALPVLALVGVYYGNSGFYPFALPGQYNSAALGALLAYQVNTQSTPQRMPVAWTPEKGKGAKHVVIIMDESIRGDFIDWTPGNTATPHLAALAPRLVNFGPAASGGVCSNYSNALLRFGASRLDIKDTANSNATLFAYARKAGYRTVFIDAQAYHIAVGHKIQNFMTVQEKNEVDGFYAIATQDLTQADFELTKIIAEELKSDKPVFIYANKNGAHFPYDSTYPPSAAKFHPTQAEVGDTLQGRIGSYRNAISWTVDTWIKDFFDKVDLSNAVMIYTSDHAQRFEPGRITHCQSTDVDERTAYVPLFAYAAQGPWREALKNGQAHSRGRASHFQIAPAVYQLLGYKPADIYAAYDESLFAGTNRPPAFTSGDIFGLFGGTVSFHPIHLDHSYTELESQ